MLNSRSFTDWSLLSVGIAVFLIGAFAPLNFGLASTVLDTETSDVHFGRVVQGDELKHSFRLRNRSSHALTISHTVMTCGCTKIENVNGKTLEGGEFLELPVSVATISKNGPWSGRVRLHYHPVSDPGALSTLELTLNAYVAPMFETDASAIDFGPVEPNNVVRREILIKSNTSWSSTDRVSVSNRSFQIRPVRTIDANRTVFELSFQPLEGQNPGTIDAIVTLQRPGHAEPFVKIPVKAVLDVAATAYPESIAIGSATEGKVVRQVIVRSREASRLISVTSQDQRVVVTKRDSSSPNLHKIEIEIDKPTTGETLSADLRIELKSVQGKEGNQTLACVVRVHRL